MLDEKDLQAIAELMSGMEQRIEQRMDEKFRQQKQEILDETTHRMNVLLETKVQKQLELLAESQQVILEKLDSKVDRTEFEDRIGVLESVVASHSREITELKRAIF